MPELSYIRRNTRTPLEPHRGVCYILGMNMDFMAAASSREDIWTRTMDFLNMPDWLKLEMVQSVGAKILHVVIWLVVSWILLKLLCQVLRKITALKMSPQASR